MKIIAILLTILLDIIFDSYRSYRVTSTKTTPFGVAVSIKFLLLHRRLNGQIRVHCTLLSRMAVEIIMNKCRCLLIMYYTYCTSSTFGSESSKCFVNQQKKKLWQSIVSNKVSRSRITALHSAKSFQQCLNEFKYIW